MWKEHPCAPFTLYLKSIITLLVFVFLRFLCVCVQERRLKTKEDDDDHVFVISVCSACVCVSFPHKRQVSHHRIKWKRLNYVFFFCVFCPTCVWFPHVFYWVRWHVRYFLFCLIDTCVEWVISVVFRSWAINCLRHEGY